MAAPPRHIAIVGGGIIGVSTLHFLAAARARLAPGSTLLLLEAAPHVANAASGKSGGFLARDWHGAATASLAELSFGLHAELGRAEGHRWAWREVETLSLNFDSSKSRSKCPKALDWVDGAHVSSTASLGGSGTTAQVTPGLLVEYLAAEAAKLDGVEIRCDAQVDGVEMHDGKVKSLSWSEHGSKESREVTDVVFAAGPWTGKLLSKLFPTRDASLPKFVQTAKHIDGSRAHSVVIEGTGPTTNHCLFTEMRFDAGSGSKAASPEVYARSDGTVYVCGGTDDVPLPAPTATVEPDRRATAQLLEQAGVLSPKVLATSAGAKVRAEQACYLPVSSGTGNPVVAYDAGSGLAVAAGHSCWGITLGLGTGKVLQELLLDGKATSADISRLG